MQRTASPSLRTSHLPLPTSRAAVTLAEVLIAMGILAIGLLGVAAVFPVGGFYVQSGDIADRGGAIAQAALEDAIIAGHLDPRNWVALHYDTVRPNFPPMSQAVESFTEGLTEALAVANPAADYLGTTYGAAYVIDPIGLAGAMEPRATTSSGWLFPLDGASMQRFPATAPLPTQNLNYQIDGPNLNPSWWPWSFGSRTWPVRRVTTTVSVDEVRQSTVDSGRLTRARALFTATDDLALTLPVNGDEPARQRVETWSNGSASFASKRQALGDYSWLLTVAPPSDAARNAFATRPDAYPVDVSAVVFHKRFVGSGVAEMREAERLVEAHVISTTPGGGEMLLERRAVTAVSGASPIAGSPFEDLRGGQFVMVVGPHPQSTSTDPRLVLRWCRVLGIQDSGVVSGALNPALNGTALNRDGDNAKVLVSLRGPDWPWQPSTTGATIADDLRVAIVPGVVAVHTKTMRLGADQGYEWAMD